MAGGRPEESQQRGLREQISGVKNFSFGSGRCDGGVDGLLPMNLTCAGISEELPAAKTCPNMTSDTSSGATAALFRTSLMTVEPRSWTGTVAKAPLKEPRREGRTGAMRAPSAACPGSERTREKPTHQLPKRQQMGSAHASLTKGVECLARPRALKSLHG